MTDHLVRADAASAEDGDGRAPDGQDTARDESELAAAAPGRWARWRERRRQRVNKWDRPPDPKDWRFFVGTLGKVLIATGILMFGFVAYQLWGTGIETARAQSQLENTFEERFAAAVAQATDDGAADDGAADASGEVGADPPDAGTIDAGADPSPDPASPDGGGNVDLDDAVPNTSRTPSAIVPGGADLSEEAVEQNVPVIPGEAFARLEIPKIGIEHYVVPGVQLSDLKKGPGHYPDTPLPGQLGNASLAGHRTTYGAPFFDIGELVPGDEMIVTMITGDQFVYRVTGLQVVTAADSWVITTRDPNVAELTLTTCHPKYTARDRLVVNSVLVPERSSQVGLAEFYQLDEPEAAAPIPGDDPTITTQVPAADGVTADDDVTTDGDVTAADVVEDAVDDGAIDPVANDDQPGTSPDPVDDIADTETDEPNVAAQPDSPQAAPPTEFDDDAEIDAFSQGWFDDRAAFSQIALWGMALTIISLLAYQVSKKTRHDSIGFLVGIAPFLFALYFFFQNVNRLLPPGL